MHRHRQCKIKLRETLGLSVYSIELEEAKLDRIVQTKTREVRKSLCKKLDNLISYKKQVIDEKKQRETKQAETNSTRKNLAFSHWD